MKYRFIIAAAIFLLMVGAAFSQTLSLDTFADPATVTYDPYSSSDSIGPQFTFTVRLSKKPSSNKYFYLLINGSPISSSRKLVYTSNSTINLIVGFFKDSAYATEIPSTSNDTSSNVISGSFARNTNVLTQQFTVYPSLQTNQYAPAGTYTGTFTLRLYNGAYPTTNLADSQSFTYTANVDPFIDVKLGPSSGSYASGAASYNIDLGDVSTSKSAQFGIFIKANTAYTLTMSAASGGYLTSTTTTDKIQYSLSIGGTTYSLWPAITIDNESAKGMYSKALTGQVSVSGGQDVEAGQYSDTVNFMISAN